MKAYVFPGQGSQYPGMAKDLYEASSDARRLMDEADTVLGFKLTEVMFGGTDEDLRQTKVTQPAIFLHSVVLAAVLGERFSPDMVAGHSLGEFSALVAAGAMPFADGVRLVSHRAQAMQRACEAQPSTMAAIIGLDDAVVEGVCRDIEGVVPANYNSPGQIVISGGEASIAAACAKLTELGAKRALKLSVSGAFHSPYMESARAELAEAIAETHFQRPRCPIYQNVDAAAHIDASEIQANLVAQLTSPVRWTQTMMAMIAAGATEFVEVGPGKVLQGLVRRTDKSKTASGISTLADVQALTA